ncbi:aspartyl-phosphate phosphatase Spo0E family protein [Clostridium sp. MB40-C1]|uniref:aspartyl-phosphate phosphatase Spo0E family protein n=1 Tax=Clostridium sp. MB40-C1 TaxID=3070996 RepID=UPI0027E1C636|nr:aspartyl-phosphate phosphatase Spo0E family protein [Clostridium sp. MB40-C1]WMJ80897.1 aspartyl-phosphate phosphatase Spo0E family protein [Clostridium sp. MB40-C1]
MKNNESLVIFIEYKIEFIRDILNHLLINLEPTNEIVVSVSQQLDKYLNEYNKLKNNNISKNTYEYIA